MIHIDAMEKTAHEKYLAAADEDMSSLARHNKLLKLIRMIMGFAMLALVLSLIALILVVQLQRESTANQPPKSHLRRIITEDKVSGGGNVGITHSVRPKPISSDDDDDDDDDDEKAVPWATRQTFTNGIDIEAGGIGATGNSYVDGDFIVSGKTRLDKTVLLPGSRNPIELRDGNWEYGHFIKAVKPTRDRTISIPDMYADATFATNYRQTYSISKASMGNLSSDPFYHSGKLIRLTNVGSEAYSIHLPSAHEYPHGIYYEFHIGYQLASPITIISTEADIIGNAMGVAIMTPQPSFTLEADSARGDYGKLYSTGMNWVLQWTGQGSITIPYPTGEYN